MARVAWNIVKNRRALYEMSLERQASSHITSISQSREAMDFLFKQEINLI